ncbi:MAG: response regulator [Spirochaetia bacterium]|jgi:PAS domain S-box-containing protein|nr:response regulator [Spirochaetia bacterium]
MRLIKNSGDRYYYRQIILDTLLKSAFVLAGIAIFPAIMLTIKTGQYQLLIIDAILVFIFIFVSFFSRFTYKAAASAFLLLIYFTGLNVLLHLGFASGAFAWFFSFTVIAALLLGLKAAIIASGINAATLFSTAFLFSYGIIGEGLPFFKTLFNAVSAISTFTFLNTVVSISIAALLSMLEKEIVKREKAEISLLQSELKYRLLTENVNEIIFTADFNMKITHITPSFRQFTGRKPEEVINSEAAALFDAEIYKEKLEKIKNLLDCPDSVIDADFDFTSPAANGEILTLEISINTYRDSMNIPAGIIAVIRNVTEKKAFLVQAERLKQMEMAGNLVGGVAHDLNNILSVIVGYPELILMDINKESNIYPLVSKISEAGGKASEIIQDMMTLAGKDQIENIKLDLNRNIRDLLDSPEYRSITEVYSNFSLAADFAENLLLISASPVNLKKSVINIIKNSLESVRDNGRIIISSEERKLDTPFRGRYALIPPGSYAVVTVRDNGPGISETDLKHIFEPFYTKKTLGRGGTGLGMTVVWKTVSACGGFIEIESRQEEGTAVYLYFPVIAGEPEAGSSGFNIKNFMGRGEKILAVDDMEEQRILAEKILEKLNYKADTAGSGNEAVSAVKKENYDLVLLDMIMENGPDGLETFKEIMKINPDQKTIIVSGYSDNEKADEVLKLGASSYVQKPYTVEKIATAVKKALALP